MTQKAGFARQDGQIVGHWTRHPESISRSRVQQVKVAMGQGICNAPISVDEGESQKDSDARKQESKCHRLQPGSGPMDEGKLLPSLMAGSRRVDSLSYEFFYYVARSPFRLEINAPDVFAYDTQGY
jgi:hypothetical protein